MLNKYWKLILIILGGLALRLYNLTAISLWHDEAFSALLIKYSWSEMMHRIGLDVHPPMYYIFLRLWHYVFGNALWSLRGFSVFFGIATIIAVYALVKTAFENKKAAQIAALFVALSPFQINFVSEARMYTMGGFFVVLSAYFLVKALRSHKLFNENPRPESDIKKQTLLFYLLFAISSIISILTHYYLLFSVAAVCLYGLIYHFKIYKLNFKKYIWMFASYLLILIGFLPWLKIFLFQYKQVGASYWIPPMDKWSIPTTIWQMLIGINKNIALSSTQIWTVAATVFSLFFLWQFLKKTNAFEKWLIVLGVIAPFGGAILFYVLSRIKGANSSVYLVRYFLFAAIFYSTALAIWISQVKNKYLFYGLILLYSLLNIYGTWYYWHGSQIKSRPGMSAAAKYLYTNVGPKDKLYIGSSFEFFNYKYYNRTPVQPLLYSGGNTEVKNLPHFAGTAILTNRDLVPDFTTATQPGDTVWLLWTNGFGGTKPPTPPSWTLIDSQSYPEIRPYIGTNIYVEEYRVN